MNLLRMGPPALAGGGCAPLCWLKIVAKYDERAAGLHPNGALLTTIRCIGNEARTILIHRGFKFKLYPTPSQEQKFREFAGVCRFVYNLALEQRSREWTHYRDNGVSLNYVQQARELTALRAEVDWIRAVSQTCQQQALKDVETAYKNFFAGRAGYPTPRRKGINDSFRFMGRECQFRRLNKSWGVVRLPKIGEVRFRWTRDIPGRVLNAAVRDDSLGWHVSFASEFDIVDEPAPDRAVGIDRGVTRALAFSDGTFGDIPIDRLNVLDRRARKHARVLSRRRKGSARRAKAKARLTATNGTVARIRKHFNHVQSTMVARIYGTVVIEALKTANMTASAKGTIENPGRNVRQKSGLNRAILERGWGQFETFLAYKIAARGGELIKVNPAYTSQTCSECGSISKHHRKSQAVFECTDCGHRQNADTNAAINILRAGTRPLGRVPVAVPVEPRISEAA